MVKRYRDYQREDRYENKPEQVKHREERNVARAHETKKIGHSPRGDVAHKVPLSGGGANTRGNIHVEKIAKNRGWRKGESNYRVPKEK